MKSFSNLRRFDEFQNRTPLGQNAPVMARQRVVAALLVLLAATPTDSYAKKGGKPGGDPPVVPPVSYAVTPVAAPGNNFLYSDHNEAAAVVGWVYDAPVGRRAMAYLPTISPNQAFYLDEPSLGVVGIPEGWHTRSAVGINNHGVVVGNLEPFGAEDTITMPFLLETSGDASGQLSVLGPFDPAAERETAMAVNDSGDVVILSQNTVGSTTVDKLYVGNPGLSGTPAAPFVEIDFASHGFVNPRISTGAGSIRLTNRQGASPVILTGVIDDGVVDGIFRMHLDGSNFELAPLYEPMFTNEEGVHAWWSASYDLNDNGDVTGQARVSATNGKGRRDLYAGIWPHDSNVIVPAASVDARSSDWNSAGTNNDGDFLLGRFSFGTLWHEGWSAANGPLEIADLIDSADPNGYLFDSAEEMTDRGASDWPVLIARGSETVDGVDQNLMLILNPVLNASASGAGGAPIPEVTTLLLALAALTSSTLVRRRTPWGRIRVN